MVPTVTFKLLCCFFAIEYGRRKILHINTTCHPTAEWVVQQWRETFPEAGQYRYVILDRDSKSKEDSIACRRATGCCERAKVINKRLTPQPLL